MASNVLWVGDLDVTHDDAFLRRVLAGFADNITSIKIIKNKQTGSSQGYGFIEFRDDASALKTLHSLNGKPMAGTTPPKRWKLNMAHQGRDNPLMPDFAIFIGDLEYSVDDLQLFNFFSARYSSVKSARVVVDEHGDSRGYGFVRFAEEMDQQRALSDMQGVLIGNKPIRVSIAAPKNRMGQTPEQQQQMSSEQLANYYSQYVQYHSYVQQWQQQQQSSYEQYYKQYYPNYYPAAGATHHGQGMPSASHMPPGYPMAASVPHGISHHPHFPAPPPVDDGARLIPHDQKISDASGKSNRTFIAKCQAIDRSYDDVWLKLPGRSLYD
ncbi:putative tRNA selenocysteine 1-associated protein 1 [Hypsibius exemplaris]|uniref:tRNA selenocysteine-associated protein 1 n=1 Tax=Hypsibius exemplaris TaxID=2072580 RepID=A0A9X6NBX7_HYPEX|nr:putative tRNA selenocysteine 1-associated protein 1 [Hypsibius exemplaris]